VFRQQIDISSFDLPKGNYSFKLIYYAGKRITHFANEDQQVIDMNAHQAKVYQGCVTSEKAFVLVK
jgi:hypothetical protein